MAERAVLPTADLNVDQLLRSPRPLSAQLAHQVVVHGIVHHLDFTQRRRRPTGTNDPEQIRGRLRKSEASRERSWAHNLSTAKKQRPTMRPFSLSQNQVEMHCVQALCDKRNHSKQGTCTLLDLCVVACLIPVCTRYSFWCRGTTCYKHF